MMTNAEIADLHWTGRAAGVAWAQPIAQAGKTRAMRSIKSAAVEAARVEELGIKEQEIYITGFIHGASIVLRPRPRQGTHADYRRQVWADKQGQ